MSQPVGAATGANRLTGDQQTSLDNLLRETIKQTVDPSIPISFKKSYADMVTLIEEISNGTRPYSDLISNAQ